MEAIKPVARRLQVDRSEHLTNSHRKCSVDVELSRQPHIASM